VVHQRVSLRDVAAAAGVSAGTASYALNGSPLVRPETRERVVAAARRLDYVPDRNATRLRRGRSECIAIGYTDRSREISNGDFYGLVVRGITERLEENGYTMRFVRLDTEASGASSWIGSGRYLNGFDIDGLLVLNWQDPALMDRLRGLRVPLVAVDASGAYPDVPSVDSDDRGGVASAIDYLVGLGHRRIALLNGTLDFPFEREMLAGYLDACERHGLLIEPRLMRTAEWSVAGGRAAMAEMVGGGAPTAVLAVDDLIAAGVIQAIHDAGLRVPADISVIGMDDLPLAAALHPALTTVHIATEEMGRQAVDMLLRVIADPPSQAPRIELPTRLVVRDSAAAPRDEACSTATGHAPSASRRTRRFSRTRSPSGRSVVKSSTETQAS
jgi:LacI family transcriptional regulator